jgi:myo-inositol 2-dehydrogenase / D-chiro-inositol 1-dehydrogenase
MGSFHARALASLAHVEVVAVADPHEANARSVAEQIGARALVDPIELASSDELDGVVIASPDSTHVELTLAAMTQGTFVLCEKPLATSVADAIRVATAEVTLGRRSVQLGFMREYDVSHIQLLAERPSLGTIHYLRAVHRNANERPRPLQQIVGQSMIHDIHSIRFLTGQEITSVMGFGSAANQGSFRHVMAVCTLSSGIHATIEFDDQGYAYDVNVEMLGANGDALTGPPSRAVRRRNGAVDTFIGPDWFEWFGLAYRTQDQAWIDSIRAGCAAGPSAWDGVMSQLVVDAIMSSLETGLPAVVEPIERPSIYAK